MQEEQRSLSSTHTISVCGLLTDRCVRWQVVTIAVVNIGMQLSGIDAVSVKSIEGLLSCLFLYTCAITFWMWRTVQLLCKSESSYFYSSQLCSTHLHLLLSIHHSPTYSHWVTKQGATGPRLIISWSSLLVLPRIRRSTHPHTKWSTSFLRVDDSSVHVGSYANTTPQQGCTHWVPLTLRQDTGRFQTSRQIHVSNSVCAVLSLEWTCLLFQRSWAFLFHLYKPHPHRWHRKWCLSQYV